MAEERNIRIEDDKGNIYYPHTKASNVKASDGKTVEEKFSEIIAPVTSVNDKTGDVVIDVPDIAGLNAGSVQLGRGTIVNAAWGIGIGRDVVSNGYSSTVAIGTSAATQEASSIAIGAASSCEGLASIAIGSDAEALNRYSGTLGDSRVNWTVPGTFKVSGTKNFEIPHPKREKKATHVIRHGAVESPTAGDTLYRYKVVSIKENDLVTIDLPDYFIWLNKDVQIWVTGQGHFGNGYGIFNRETEQLEIHCQYEGEYNILVIGTRNDDHQSVQDWDIKGVEREVGESWTGETYAFTVDEIMEIDEIKEEE